MIGLFLSRGGILNKIDSSRVGTIENLGPYEEITIRINETILGFGKIDITITAETTIYTTTGIVIGPFIIVKST